MIVYTNGQLLTKLFFNPGKTISLLKARTSTPAKASSHRDHSAKWRVKYHAAQEIIPPMTHANINASIIALNFDSSMMFYRGRIGLGTGLHQFQQENLVNPRL